MFYKISEGHGLPHDPLKALIAPRPIAWVGTRGEKGDNLAPFSFFALLSMTQIGFSIAPDFRSEGIKDTLTNLRTNPEFSVSLPSLKHAQNVANSAASLSNGDDEFEYYDIPKSNCRLINAPYVGDAQSALECQMQREIDLGTHRLIIGEIVAVHISENILDQRMVDNTKMKNLARLGYFDYSAIEDVFPLKTPKV